MPYFRLDTNISKNEITQEFLQSTTKLIASIFNKPENYVIVQVNPEQALTWNGTNEPAGYVLLMSNANLGIELNKQHAKAIYDHIFKSLGLSMDRLYIQFFDASPSVVECSA